MNYNIFRNKTVKISRSLIDDKIRISQFEPLILDYKLVIEKILKIVIRQVLMIYM